MQIPQWLKDLPPFVSAGIAALSLLIACFSALISACSLYVNWRNYRRDRHRVLVELKWNAEAIVFKGAGGAQERMAHIRVTNQGRRPVSIEFVGLEIPGRPRTVNWLDSPARLNEGDPPLVIKIYQDDSLAPFVQNWKKIYASAYDATGYGYKSKTPNERPVIVPGFHEENQKRLREIEHPL